jgi:phosphatidate cytidylyltransferase
MELWLYGILIAYFILGGMIMAIVNRRKGADERRKNWIKYVVYLFLVNLLFIAILFWPRLFQVLCLTILVIGFLEITRHSFLSNNWKTGGIALLLFVGLSYLFYHFSLMSSNYHFYALFLTTVFDSFSQLGGQLFGKRKLIPSISPNKTIEGLLIGLLVALLTAALIHKLLVIGTVLSMLIGLGVIFFAFWGDLAASYCKRRFKIKDFSRLLPGHGGILDRFDSLIAAGAFLWVIEKILGL